MGTLIWCLIRNLRLLWIRVAFLFRNCQWSLDFFGAWAPMGPKGTIRDEVGKILTAFLEGRLGVATLRNNGYWDRKCHQKFGKLDLLNAWKYISKGNLPLEFKESETLLGRYKGTWFHEEKNHLTHTRTGWLTYKGTTTFFWAAGDPSSIHSTSKRNTSGKQPWNE